MLKQPEQLLSDSIVVLSTATPFVCGGTAESLPGRVKILGWGLNVGRTTSAKIIVDDLVAANLTANQELVACDEVPMDYEHQSVPGHPNYIPDPRFSPGSGKIEVIPGEGVFLSGIDYTPNGLKMASSYQDVSAVAHLDKNNRLLWVSSVALTQRGDVAGMEFSESVAALSARPNLTTQHPTKKKMKNDTVFRDLIIKLLGITAAAGGEVTDEQITAAVEAAVKKKAEESTPEDAPKAETTATLSAWERIEKRLDDTERAALIAAASRDGKVIPLSADMISQVSVAVLSAMIAKLPANEVPLETKTSKEKVEEKVVAPSADEKAAAKSLGLTEDEFRKSKA